MIRRETEEYDDAGCHGRHRWKESEEDEEEDDDEEEEEPVDLFAECHGGQMSMFSKAQKKKKMEHRWFFAYGQ